MAEEKVGKPNPWGQHNEAVDAAGREMKEKEVQETNRRSAEIAAFTEDLKKQVREGDIESAFAAFEMALAPATEIQFEYSPHARTDFVMTVLEETGKKHGRSGVQMILEKANLSQPTINRLLENVQSKSVGWKA